LCVRPDVPRSFADIPTEIRRRVAGGERVALVLLDALGLALLHRHEDHPLLRRLQITPLASQLPSTTTAHVTTMHFGVPLPEHGLYEWNILEPALDEVICPLRFNLAGSDVPEELVGRLDPAVLAPGPTFYETLGAPAFVLQPRAIEHSTFTRLATRGATVHGFETLAEGLASLGRILRAVDGPAYAFLYWDEIDRVGHEHGPASPQFHAEARAALDAVQARLAQLRGLTVLLCADHGQVDVSPERVDYLDDLWPPLAGRLLQRRPAGSARDVFLHVREEHVEEVIRELAARLDDRARVAPATSLFGVIGPRLRDRLGQVVVLPAPGRQAWLRSAAANERWVLGQHGGLEPAETATYLAEVVRL
jgi:type I phosphodiesterase/nucleotide pyrophosphatase